MVTLHNGNVMIVGADKPTSLSRNVIIFDPDNKTFMNGPSLTDERRSAACTLFKSSMHNDRPVVLAAGGENYNTAEVYDYTYANQWQTSIHLIYTI